MYILCGDLNSRCGRLSNRVDQLGLDRYVNLPHEDEYSFTIEPRVSSDKRVNSFGRKLLSLCKEHHIVIMNGRIEPGGFTCITQSGSSVVDFFITQMKNIQQINDLYVSELTEFSDHCFVVETYAYCECSYLFQRVSHKFSLMYFDRL